MWKKDGKFSVGWDFRGDNFKELYSFSTLEEAWLCYLDMLKVEFDKLGNIPNSLCIVNKDTYEKISLRAYKETMDSCL